MHLCHFLNARRRGRLRVAGMPAGRDGYRVVDTDRDEPRHIEVSESEIFALVLRRLEGDPRLARAFEALKAYAEKNNTTLTEAATRAILDQLK